MLMITWPKVKNWRTFLTLHWVAISAILRHTHTVMQTRCKRSQKCAYYSTHTHRQTITHWPSVHHLLKLNPIRVPLSWACSIVVIFTSRSSRMSSSFARPPAWKNTRRKNSRGEKKRKTEQDCKLKKQGWSLLVVGVGSFFLPSSGVGKGE